MKNSQISSYRIICSSQYAFFEIQFLSSKPSLRFSFFPMGRFSSARICRRDTVLQFPVHQLQKVLLINITTNVSEDREDSASDVYVGNFLLEV
jgi:hypothetical protein